MKKNKFTLLPFFSDVLVLIIGFFISVIVVQHMLIVKSERPIELSIDQYFDSSEWELDSLSRVSLKVKLSTLFLNMEDLLGKGRLKSVRIEGHADEMQPDSSQLSNLELSLKRAFIVSKLFEEIATERLSGDTLTNFLGMLSPTGKGEYNKKYDYEKYNNEYFIMKKTEDGTIRDTTFSAFYKRSDAKNAALRKNRRIEIIEVYK